MKVVILCGGMGTRIREETEFRPKPMVEIGGRPILWHIMKLYAAHGFKEFVLCLGYKGDYIKDYFLNYPLMACDFTVHLGREGRVEAHAFPEEEGWQVTLADTGLTTMTGARVKKIERYITGDTFMLTYGDGVSNVPIDRLVEFHRSHGKLATVTGVRPPARWGELVVNGDTVEEFREKPQIQEGYINGGFFVLNRGVFDYLSDDPDCNFERGPLDSLASDRQLQLFPHHGFWQAMDTYRDNRMLNDMWDSGQAEWRVW